MVATRHEPSSDGHSLQLVSTLTAVAAGVWWCQGHTQQAITPVLPPSLTIWHKYRPASQCYKLSGAADSDLQIVIVHAHPGRILGNFNACRAFERHISRKL